MIENEIKKFLKSDDNEIVFKTWKQPKIPDVSPDTLFDSFIAAGGTLEEERDTNGWELDYWQKGTYKGEVYTLEGTAWYGLAKIVKGWDY